MTRAIHGEVVRCSNCGANVYLQEFARTIAAINPSGTIHDCQRPQREQEKGRRRAKA